MVVAVVVVAAALVALVVVVVVVVVAVVVVVVVMGCVCACVCVEKVFGKEGEGRGRKSWLSRNTHCPRGGTEIFGGGHEILGDTKSFWGRYAAFMLTAFAQQRHTFIYKKHRHQTFLG